MHQDMNFLYNREEQEYNEFMAKLFKKGKEVSDDFKKLSPENQQKVNDTIKQITGLQTLSQIFPIQ